MPKFKPSDIEKNWEKDLEKRGVLPNQKAQCPFNHRELPLCDACKELDCNHEKAQENWKDKIRLDYAGIISPEQIEATIIYWEDFISAQTAKAREEGYQEGLFLRKEYNDPELLSKICSEELKKAREEEYKKGYNDCLREQKLTGEKYQKLYL